MTERLGIFGGTFSPPHKGHIQAAKAFIEEAALDRLLVMPAFIPPHKLTQGGATPHQRYEMCRLAFSALPRTEVSDLEIRLGGASYTYRTLETLAAPGRTLCLLIGTDMMLSLELWRYPERIFSSAELYCIRRESDKDITRAIAEKNDFFKQKFGHKVSILEHTPLPVSSTEIRAALRNGENTPLLTEEVRTYIEREGLYHE